MMNPKQRLLEKKYVDFCLSKPDPKEAAKGFSKSVRETVEKEMRKRKPAPVAKAAPAPTKDAGLEKVIETLTQEKKS